MKNLIFVNTMRYPNACMDQRVATKVDNASMVTRAGAYTSRQGVVERETNAIFTMEEREPLNNQIPTEKVIKEEIFIMM